MIAVTPEGLKPCPFCGGRANIERFGNGDYSTIYQCDDCGCTLETGEEWDHGRAWNTRPAPSPATDEVVAWRCFHCDEVFTDRRCAAAHFGANEDADPACQIKMGGERTLIEALRRAERDAGDAWAAIHAESTEAARAYYAQQSRHLDQITAAEQVGYERGLADVRGELLFRSRDAILSALGGTEATIPPEEMNNAPRIYADGVTDDTAALQWRLDRGLPVPRSGTVRVTETLRLPTPPEGEG